MANTIGTIEISMLANLASLTSDMGKASQESAKHAREVQRQWQDSLNSIEETFRGLAEAFGVGLSIAGLVEVAKQSLDTAEKVQNMSKSFGFSTQAIQTMGYAAALVGGNLDGATAAMARLERSAEQAAAGNVQAAAAFKAIGIDAAQVAQLLKTPDELLQTVAQHMAAFGDGAGKTAAAMQIFGRGAAEIIPLLDELGSNYDELRKRAEGLGVVLSSQDQAGLVAAKEGFNDLKEAAVGLGNQFTIAMLPAINGIIEGLDSLAESGAIRSFFKDLGTDVGQFVVIAGQVAPVIAGWLSASESATGGIKSDFVSMVQSIKDWTVELANRFANNWEIMKAAWALFVAYLQNEFHLGIAQVENDLAGLAEFTGKVLAGFGNPAALDSFNALAAGLRQAASGYKEVTADLTPYSNAIAANNDALRTSLAENQRWADGTRLTAESVKIMTTGLDEFKASLVKGDIAGNLKKLAEAEQNVRDTAKEMIAAGADEAKVNADATQAIKTLTGVVKEADAAQVQYDANAKAHASTIKALAKDYEEVAKFLDQLSGKIGGPYSKAMAEYAGAIDKARAMAAKFAADGMKAVEVQKFLAEATTLATQHLQEQTDANTVIQRVLDDINQKYTEEARVIGLTGQAREIEAEYTRLQTQMNKELLSVMGPLTEEQQRQVDSLHNLAAAHVMERDAAKKAEEVEKQWQSIAVSGFDSVGKSIADFATGGIKTWHDFGKSLLGDAKQFIAQIIQEFLKLTIFNGIINRLFNLSGSGALPEMSAGSILGNVGGLFGGVSGGSGGVAGLVSNFSGGASAGSIFSPSTWIDAGKNIYSGFTSLFSGGSTPVGNPLSPGFVGPPDSTGAYYGPPAPGGGALGYGGYGSAIGQGLGVAGGLYAGYNEFQNAGGGLAGVAGGVAYGFGTYFAGAAITSGLAAAATGGIAAGISAGFLAVPVVGWIAIAAMLIDKFSGGKLFGTSGKPIGGQLTETIGASGATLAESMTYKGQHALFGGSYYHDKNIPVDPAAQKAADDFFAALTKGTADFAKQFGVAAADIVGGTFVQHFDKKGNPTTTDDTVLGVTYHEDQQHFAERLQADSYLAVLDKMGIGASAFVAGLQSDADKLMAGVQDLAQAAQIAQADITKGIGLLGKDGGIAAVMAEVIKLNDGNEKLADEYVRLQQETIGLQAILDTTGLSIGKTGADFVEFADAAAKAAGGIQNLTQLANQFAKDFYSASELTATGIANLKTKVAGEFATIGEDPTESLAKFRQDFEAALPTMSPEDLAKWYQAGVDLASLNQAVQSAAQNYAQFIAQFNAPSGLTQFEQAMVNLGDSITANVKKANDLAIANGLAGASAADIGKIIAASVAQGAKMLQALQQEAAQLSGQLFGTSLDQLKQQLSDAQARLDHASQTGQYDLRDQALSKSLSAQIAQSDAQAKAQQQFAQAASLLGDLGQIGAVTGQSLQDFAKQFGIPLDKFATMLGTDAAGLNKDFGQQEAMAKAALNTEQNTKYTNELLADILAASRNQPLPFDTSTLIADSSNPSGKSSGHGYAPPGGGSTQPASRQEVSSPKVEKLLGDLISEIQSARREGVISNRNTAGVR